MTDPRAQLAALRLGEPLRLVPEPRGGAYRVELAGGRIGRVGRTARGWVMLGGNEGSHLAWYHVDFATRGVLRRWLLRLRLLPAEDVPALVRRARVPDANFLPGGGL